MKWMHVVAKNLKLLFRSKESAFTIIFGPLLIILLVSAAYTGGDEHATLRVGTVASAYTPLADQMVTSLKKKGYLVSTFTDEAACIGLVKEGKLHTCILFPDGFKVEQNRTSVITFAVDYSRINLVYQVIDGLGGEFALQRASLTEGIAGTMLQRVALAQQQVRQGINDTVIIDADIADVRERLRNGTTALDGVNMTVSFTELRSLRGSINGLGTTATMLGETGKQAVADAIDALLQASDHMDNVTQEMLDQTILDLKNASKRMSSLSDTTPRTIQETSAAIDDAAAALERARTRFDQLVNASRDVNASLTHGAVRLTDAATRLARVRGSLEYVDTSLEESLGMSATSISAPIATRIRAVNTQETKLAFTYPYILLLVIMFLGLMLGSALVVMDKTSRAAFRNFTIATRDEYHVLLSFVTTFLILLVQVGIILLLSASMLHMSLFANFGVSLVIISVAITLFSFVGMAIGYMSSNQESAMITSLSLGSILLFISNLVLPLETMNRLVQSLSAYNPYVVLSELLKQSMLFGLHLHDVPGKVATLLVAIAILFGVIVAVQRSVKASYFRRRSKDLAAGEFAPTAHATAPLRLQGKEVRDLFDLHAVLDAMTRTEFEAIVTQERNPIAAWVHDEVRDRKLARKLETHSKEMMILTLDSHLKKLTRRLAKE